LTAHFLAELGQDMCTPVRSISKDAIERLQTYDWPGNVRELRNVIESAMVLGTKETLTASDLLLGTRRGTFATGLKEAGQDQESHIVSLAEVERETILRALKACNGNKREAAEKLGISRNTLHEKLKRYRDSAQFSDIDAQE